MGIDSLRSDSFEKYDEGEIQRLVESGWQMDADGLDEATAQEMTQSINAEYRAFRKEDGTCTILVKQQSAYESMGGSNVDQMRGGVRSSVNDIMGESGSSNRP